MVCLLGLGLACTVSLHLVDRAVVCLSVADDGHHQAGDGAGGHAADSSVELLRQPSSPVAAVAGGGDDELRRQAKKERIRERILQDEAEHWKLEAEVRRELMEQLFPLLRSGNAAPAGASSAAPIVLQENASSPVSPAKRKEPTAAAAVAAVVPAAPSTVSAATSSKRAKLDLTCALCGITSTGEKAMQEHLDGKGHKRRAAAQLARPVPEPEHEEEDTAAMIAHSEGGYTPTKLTMQTNAGVLNDVLQMDGYLLCEVCNVSTADRITMLCHLEGTKHVTKALKLQQQAGKSPAPAVAAASKKSVKADRFAPVITAAAATDGEAAGTVVVVEINGAAHTLRRTDDGCLLCELCGVKTPSEGVVQSHLTGRKHRNMAAKAAATASFGTGSGEETNMASKVGENAKVQETEAMAEEGVTTNVDHHVLDTPGEETKKVGSHVASVASTVTGVPEPVVIVVDGEQHVVKRVGGILCCVRCFVNAPSENVMRSHLVGRKHKNKVALQKGQLTPAAAPLPAHQVGAAFAGDSTLPIVIEANNKPANIGNPARLAAADADGEKAKAAAPDAGRQEVKIQVEGRMFVVLRQPNGTLLCEPCRLHCYDRGDMLQHLYTKGHWDKLPATST
ncbi:hypothetical protein GUJ93_ZPchr0010g7416 [Zizania palustris]|uniref:C2H2-type domain-containing protein n=1 Tax=Zizania palustris TaxID=103762 RepID=A0A8J5WEZ8_ZIZPA|nr:hypothetical protein GUJ93_ZPchr0010g7416 [Zizania palustris]